MKKPSKIVKKAEAKPDSLALRRNRLLALFESKEPIWKDKDHPELADRTAAWVRRLRGHE